MILSLKVQGRRKLPKCDPLARAAWNRRDWKGNILKSDEKNYSRSVDVIDFLHETKGQRIYWAHLKCLLPSKAESTGADKRDGSDGGE
jgi:hypothetical protein